MALLQKLLGAAVRARSLSSPRAAAARDMLPIARRASGCVMRLVLTVVVLLIALVGAAFLFGRALLGL